MAAQPHAQMKQTEYEDLFYLLKFSESQDYIFKKYQAHNLSRVLYHTARRTTVTLLSR